MFEELFGEISPMVLLAVIAGVVQFCKEQLGVSGKWAVFISLGLGLAFSLGHELSEVLPTVHPWFEAAVYGLIAGMTVSGLYDLVPDLARKALRR